MDLIGIIIIITINVLIFEKIQKNGGNQENCDNGNNLNRKFQGGVHFESDLPLNPCYYVRNQNDMDNFRIPIGQRVLYGNGHKLILIMIINTS